MRWLSDESMSPSRDVGAQRLCSYPSMNTKPWRKRPRSCRTTQPFRRSFAGWTTSRKETSSHSTRFAKSWLRATRHNSYVAEVFLTRSAREALTQLGCVLADAILDALAELERDPDIGYALRGRLRGLYSYRVGAYRIIYELRDGTLGAGTARGAGQNLLAVWRRLPQVDLPQATGCDGEQARPTHVTDCSLDSLPVSRKEQHLVPRRGLTSSRQDERLYLGLD